MKQNLFDNSLLGDNESDYLTLEDIKQYPEYQTVKKIYDSLPSKDTRQFGFSKDYIYITDSFILFKIKSSVSAELINKTARAGFIEKCDKFFATAKEQQNKSSETIINPKEAVKTVNKYNRLLPEISEEYYLCLNYRKNNKIVFKPKNIKAVFSNLKDKFYNVYLSELTGGLDILYINTQSVEVLCVKDFLEKWDNWSIIDLPTGYFVENERSKILISFIEDEIPRNNEMVEIYGKSVDNGGIAMKIFNDFNNKSKIYDELYTELTGKKSKAVFYDTTPDKTKLDLFRFASTEDRRPILNMIGYQKGFAAATDATIMVWVKDQYIKEYEGQCYDKLGNKYNGTYPNFMNIVPDLKKRKYIELQLDTDRLKQAVDMAKKLTKSKVDILRTIKLGNDEYFNATYLEKVLYFLEYCISPKVYFINDDQQLLYITDKNGVHNLLLMAVRYNYGIKCYVDYKVLKYCVDFSLFSWNEDKTKILEIIKGNYINLELLKSEFELLDNNQENTNTNGLMGLSDYQKKSQNILGYIKNKLTLSGSKVYPKFAVGSLIRYGEYFDGTVYKIVDTNTEGYEVIDISMPKNLRSRNTIPFCNNDLLVECNIQTLELLCEL